MSHAANLRSRQRAHAPPPKKQKLLEISTRPQTNGINGFLKDPASHKLSAAPARDAKALKQRHQDNAAAKVGHADGDVEVTQGAHEIVEISSGSSEDEDEDDEDHHADDAQVDPFDKSKDQRPIKSIGPDASTTLGQLGSSEEQAKAGQSEPNSDADADSAAEAEGEECSFGDLLRAHEGMTVDLTAQNEDSGLDQDSGSIQRQPLPVPTANSLGTVLSQALRTNDTPLLESCFHVGNLQSIRATIERLPSSQAGTLLQKLAERMHKRPGRAGSLMVWVQWTIVAHGGYLATQPAVMAELRELYRVVKQRASALQPLLTLKGKLDMLEAQLQLRRNRMAQFSQDEARDDEDIIYIEGETSDDEPANERKVTNKPHSAKPLSSAKERLYQDLRLDGDDGADDVPMVNGVAESGYDEDNAALDDDESDDEDLEDLIDDEAESTDSDDEDGFSDDDIDFNDIDGQEHDSASSDDGEPGPKRSKVSKG